MIGIVNFQRMILAVTRFLSSNERPERDSHRDLCDAGAVVYQLNHQLVEHGLSPIDAFLLPLLK